MSSVNLTYPYDETQVRALRAGDRVQLSGSVFTGRDRFHKWIVDNRPTPCDMRDGALYHCGPVVIDDRDGFRVLAAGPTTSMREEPYQAEVIEKLGVRVVIGKGGMGQRTLDACRRLGCVYVQAVGGAASLLAACIRRVHGVYLLDEFGAAEAVWHFEVEELGGMVTMDSTGASLYESVSLHSRQALEELLR